MRVEAFLPCGGSNGDEGSTLDVLEPCALLGKFARRELERTQSPAIVAEEVLLFGEGEREDGALCVFADEGMGTACGAKDVDAVERGAADLAKAGATRVSRAVARKECACACGRLVRRRRKRAVK